MVSEAGVTISAWLKATQNCLGDPLSMKMNVHVKINALRYVNSSKNLMEIKK